VLDPAKGDCIVKEVDRLKIILADSSVAPQDKVEPLKFLVHFIGDAHQPLHTVLDAKGGLGITVSFFTDPYRKQTGPTNLHVVWDTGLIRAKYWDWGAYVDYLETKWLPAQNIAAIQSGTLIAWIADTHKLANEIVEANVKDGDSLVEDYFERASPALDDQLGKAGLRLAGILDTVFAEK